MTTPTLSSSPPEEISAASRIDETRPVSGSPPTSTVPPARVGRRRWFVALAAGLAVLLVLGGWLVWSRWVPSAPGTPVSQVTTATSVQLSWTRSTEGPAVDQYLVMRNGGQVASVAGSVTTYLDQALKPDTAYQYTVVAGSGSKRSEPSQTLVVHTLPAPPTALSVVASGDTVTIRWGPPAVGSAPDGYVVLRDGSERATLPGTARSFQDTGLTPRTTYAYSVLTVTAGLRSEPPTAVSVTIPDPPVANARLEGDHDLSGKIVAGVNAGTIGGKPAVGYVFAETWQFSPSCPTGPCSKVLVQGYVFDHPFSMTLTRSGTVYTGSTQAHISHCTLPGRAIDTINTVKLRITVTKADLSYATWTATSWTGTMQMLTPYASNSSGYCPSGSITASLAGSPAGAQVGSTSGSLTGPVNGVPVAGITRWLLPALVR